MSREPDPILLSQIVRRAAEIADPDATHPAVGEFELRYEDDDVPASAVLDGLEARIGFGADEDPAVMAAQAVVLYLAHKRGEVADADQHILEKALRAEWEGHPPYEVLNWAEATHGVSL